MHTLENAVQLGTVDADMLCSCKIHCNAADVTSNLSVTQHVPLHHFAVIWRVCV